MTGTRCCVPGCHNNTKYNRNVSWHVFPKSSLRDVWIARVRRRGLSPHWEPKAYTKICGIHFNLTGRKTRYDTLPKHFITKKGKRSEENKGENDQGAKLVFSCPRFKQVVARKPKEISLEDIDIGAEYVIGKRSTNTKDVRKDIFVGNFSRRHNGDHTYCLKNEISFKVIELESKVEQMSKIIRTQVATINMLNQRIREEDPNTWRMKYFELKKKCRDGECASRDRLSIELILEVDEALEFFTGFKNSELFVKFSDLIRPAYKGIRTMTANGGRPRSLCYLEELFMVYSRLRLNLLEDDLATKFGISRGTVSNVWSHWINLLYTQLTQIPSDIGGTGPRKLIIDCVELSTETPSDENERIDTYSEQKAQYTVKGLLGIRPNGVVAFVSNLYGGRKSNRALVKDCGLLDFLTENEEVVGDNGFTVDDFSGKEINFLRVDSLSGELLTLRNKVEIIVEQIRDFAILKTNFHNTMRFKLNKIWKVCCLSLNFLSGPLFDDPLF